jgi:hypothetical protein
MTGMLTRKSTTTFRVKRLPITREQFANMVRSSYAKAGFSLDDASAKVEADELLRLASELPADAILEKRGKKIQAR